MEMCVSCRKLVVFRVGARIVQVARGVGADTSSTCDALPSCSCDDLFDLGQTPYCNGNVFLCLCPQVGHLQRFGAGIFQFTSEIGIYTGLQATLSYSWLDTSAPYWNGDVLFAASWSSLRWS